MFRKSLAIGLVVVLLAGLGGAIGCEAAGISGSFVCTHVTVNFEEGTVLELRTDGTAYWHPPEAPAVGAEYEVHQDEITISTNVWGSTIVWKGEISGDTMVLVDGSTWVKE